MQKCRDFTPIRNIDYINNNYLVTPMVENKNELGFYVYPAYSEKLSSFKRNKSGSIGNMLATGSFDIDTLNNKNMKIANSSRTSKSNKRKIHR